ncbi:hypothetical protein COO60DRAFT_722918 [Scenedesmus sp. NREL 46B-D3]|nr:hypothetical protein COO60DRAFT_722918 [Scenedesmus sp. NREL 46B-D3]
MQRSQNTHSIACADSTHSRKIWYKTIAASRVANGCSRACALDTHHSSHNSSMKCVCSALRLPPLTSQAYSASQQQGKRQGTCAVHSPDKALESAQERAGVTLTGVDTLLLACTPAGSAMRATHVTLIAYKITEVGHHMCFFAPANCGCSGAPTGRTCASCLGFAAASAWNNSSSNATTSATARHVVPRHSAPPLTTPCAGHRTHKLQKAACIDHDSHAAHAHACHAACCACACTRLHHMWFNDCRASCHTGAHIGAPAANYQPACACACKTDQPVIRLACWSHTTRLPRCACVHAPFSACQTCSNQAMPADPTGKQRIQL